TLLMAKMLVPETEQSLTAGRVEMPEMEKEPNVLGAVSRGTIDGLHLALNVGAMLVTFIALLALVNAMMGWGHNHIAWFPDSLQRVFGRVLSPVAWVIGIPWHDCKVMGNLLGTRMVINELVAFQQLGALRAALDPRSFTIATFALCGAADFVFSRTKLRPQIALVLGSGLGAFAEEFSDATKIPYGEIPYFPRSTAVGHAGQLVIGKVGAVSVAGMQGRVHLYEGYSAKEIVFPVRVFARMGVKAVILTNAAGGIKREFSQGRLVVISDHINLQGVNPLTGPNDERFGLRFHDMTNAYDKRFREMTFGEANRLGIGMYEGVYAALLGPSYETPAEIRYLRTIGADLVG